jgi:hypothetical protein
MPALSSGVHVASALCESIIWITLPSSNRRESNLAVLAAPYRTRLVSNYSCSADADISVKMHPSGRRDSSGNSLVG